MFHWLGLFSLVLSLFFTSCSSDEEELQEEINLTYLIGCWENDDNGECWEYKSDQKGVYWDPAESTYEEASKGSGLFSWYVDETGLMHIFYMETTSDFSDPDPDAPYIIEELTTSHMTYKTSAGARVGLTKFYR